MDRVLAVVIAAAALAGCGAPADNSAAGQQFKAQFAKNMHDSCLKTAVSKGAPADKAEAYCSCVVAETDRFSNADRLAAGMNPEKLRPLGEACLYKLPN